MKILVIGAERRNVGDTLWDHPDITYLDTHELIRRGIPPTVDLVILTRFMQHVSMQRVRTAVKQRKVKWMGPLSTGQLKQELKAQVGGR